MRVIIFNDTQNFNGSLNFVNYKFKKKEKRFWDYKRYIPFLIEKLKSIDGMDKTDFKLIKTFFYEGKYSSTLINKSRWNCNQKISKLNEIIKKEKTLLNFISQGKLSPLLRRKINLHVEEIKKELESKKNYYFKYISKQKRNYEGQKKMLRNLENNPLIEVRMTPLKQIEGEVYQKGVDVLLATDLIHLAHIDAYDIAIILSGDTDLIEAVKLVKTLGKTPIIFSYHTLGDSKLSNISDLMNVGKFINIKNFTDEEIFKMSELRKRKDN